MRNRISKEELKNDPKIGPVHSGRIYSGFTAPGMLSRSLEQHDCTQWRAPGTGRSQAQGDPEGLRTVRREGHERLEGSRYGCSHRSWERNNIPQTLWR